MRQAREVPGAGGYMLHPVTEGCRMCRDPPGHTWKAQENLWHEVTCKGGRRERGVQRCQCLT